MTLEPEQHGTMKGGATSRILLVNCSLEKTKFKHLNLLVKKENWTHVLNGTTYFPQPLVNLKRLLLVTETKIIRTWSGPTCSYPLHENDERT